MRLRRGVLIGRPFGIPLLVHGSWFPAALLLVVHFVLTAYSRLPMVAAVAFAVVSSSLFFASLVAHELAHALVAKGLRIPVLDITLFVFGGVARIGREPSKPSQETMIAAAGPLTSAAIGGAALLIARPGGYAGYVLWTIGLGNLALAAFNLLPGFPLDGGRILRAWLWARTGDPHGSALRAARAGQGIGASLAAAGGFVWALSTADVEGVWLVVLGGFLYAIATASRRASRLAARLGREAAGGWASPFAGTLRPDQRLSARDGGDGPYAVSADGRLAGVVLPGAMAGAAYGCVAADVMVPWTSNLGFPAAEPLTRALERLSAADSGVLVVVDESGNVVGVLDTEGVRARLESVGR